MDFVQHRAGTLFLLFFVLLVLACSRTMYLDVFRGATLRKAGTAEHLTEEVVSPRRGAITDRDGVELAVSEPAQDLSADPFLVHDPDALSKRLAPLLGQSSSSILEKLSEQRGFVYLARALPEAQAEAVLNLKVPGINGTPVMRRVYPRGTLAAQLLGFVGTEGQGLSGLEYADNRLLAGSAGKRKVVSDALGQPLSISESHPEQPGTGISLTLDSNIQARAEQVLAAVGRVFEPKDATAIVMNPRDGELLAVANWPQINANDPSASPSSALEDRAVSFDYEPGSTFKIVTIGGSLQEGLITPQSGFVVPDQIQVADRTIHDDTEHPEETLSVSEILARSSNVGTIEIGKLLGAEAFNGWSRRFGFGSPAGAGLAGEEQGVVLPLSQYSGSSMGNLPIGQGELVTPMQMVAAYAAVANGGILRPPHIIGSIGGRPVPEPPGRRVISSATAASIR
ncbi:MAG TPA: penicillin-binding protein 2, partial [Solirubrobacteraceae bacterium]|nr:penicillin-binding protein 2 [Solirubrobacteraceae bacterium]